MVLVDVEQPTPASLWDLVKADAEAMLPPQSDKENKNGNLKNAASIREKNEAEAQTQLEHRQQEGLLVLHSRIHKEYFRACADDDDADDNDEKQEGLNDDIEEVLDDFEGDLPAAWEALSSYFPVLAHAAKHSLASSRRFSAQRKKTEDLLSLLKTIQEYRNRVVAGPSLQEYDFLAGILPSHTRRVTSEGSAKTVVAAAAAAGNGDAVSSSHPMPNEGTLGFDDFIPFLNSTHGGMAPDSWKRVNLFSARTYLAQAHHAASIYGAKSRCEVLANMTLMRAMAARQKVAAWCVAVSHKVPQMEGCSVAELDDQIDSGKADGEVRAQGIELNKVAPEPLSPQEVSPTSTDGGDIMKGSGAVDCLANQRNKENKMPTTRDSNALRTPWEQAEPLAAALLGREMLRCLFLDVLGRYRQSDASFAFRLRAESMLPSKQREWSYRSFRIIAFCAAAVALLSFIVGLLTVLYRDSAFYTTWHLACLLYVAQDMLIVQANVTLILSCFTPAYYREIVHAALINLCNAAMKLWVDDRPRSLTTVRKICWTS